MCLYMAGVNIYICCAVRGRDWSRELGPKLSIHFKNKEN